VYQPILDELGVKARELRRFTVAVPEI
jgi:hypothetical protein